MPGNRQAFSAAMNAADRFRWDSQWTEAANEYHRALTEFPDDAAARGGLGFCYMQTKQWQKALTEYEYILKRDPDNVIALSKTAELYVILYRRDDAYPAYMHLAELYSQAGQGARAEAAWQKAVQLSPASPEPHERLATYYLRKKDIALMVQERLNAAQGYLLRNDSAAASAQCQEVLRVDANNTQAQRVLLHIRGQLQPSGPLPKGVGAAYSSPAGRETGKTTSGSLSSGPLAEAGNAAAGMVSLSNTSGGNTGNMGNMGSAGNFGGVGNPGPALAATGMAGGGMGPAPRKRITASQVTGVLRQAQTFQTQGRFNDAIDLCEQILESGFDRPDARYFLGWLYQEQRRWDEAIRQFQTLLNDPDYALSCYYALGQCYRAKGDMRTATIHFDEAVDRVNLDALTVEESDQLVQLCQESAEAHRLLGEQEQALTVYNALLGFLRSRGWNDKVTQVEFMLKQAQNTPLPPRPVSTPLPNPAQPAPQQNSTRVLPPEQMTMVQQAPAVPAQPNMPDTATVTMNMNGSPAIAPTPAASQPTAAPPAQVQPPIPSTNSGSLGELPDWLTGILNDADKTQSANKQAPSTPAQPAPVAPAMQEALTNQPTVEQPVAPNLTSSTSWLTGEVKPVTAAPVSSPGQQAPVAPAQAAAKAESSVTFDPTVQIAPTQKPPAPEPPIQAIPRAEPLSQSMAQATPGIDPAVPSSQVSPAKRSTGTLEALLNQISSSVGKEGVLQRVSESILASTATLPENIRIQVVQSIQDIQRYIDHGLLTAATEECLRVIDLAPQYLDIHQVLCEIYIRQGKIDQAITKYAILIDTYVVNGRIHDAIATYRRILQLEPNNLTYRVRLINLLASQGNKEDLLHERSLAAESYLRLGYMDRALTELEQALQESPTSVMTRLNYALALQKLGRSQQAVAEYQRVLQVDPRNITALVRWHIAMITGVGTARATTLEVLTRIRWQLRGEGQRNYETVVREYTQAAETYPNNFDIRFALGQIHLQAGYFDLALDAYQFAIRDSSYEVMARVSSAHCLLTQGKPEAAIQQLEQALQSVRGGQRGAGAIDPADWAARPREEGEEHQAPEVEISLLLAKAYGRIGKQDQMQAILRQVKQTTPHRDEVASALAEISARQGDVGSALQEYADLVRFYRDKRQGDSALSVLKEMVRMAPQDPRAHAELGDIYVSRGLLEEGIAELRLLADIYLRQNQLNEAGETLRRIGNIYAETGNTDDAFMNLRRAVDLKPNDMDLLREVVGYCWQIGRAKEATHYQSIIAHHYFETNQIKESVAALQQLIALDRTNYEAYDMLGQTYQSVGEYEQASRVYKNLAKANPGGTIARERLAMLQELRAQNA